MSRLSACANLVDLIPVEFGFVLACCDGVPRTLVRGADMLVALGSLASLVVEHVDVLRVYTQGVLAGSARLVLSAPEAKTFSHLDGSTHRNGLPLALDEKVDQGQVSALGVVLPDPALTFFEGSGLDTLDESCVVEHVGAFLRYLGASETSQMPVNAPRKNQVTTAANPR